jgi:peptidoglycan/LPS O-acetylase OafA/YrhL
MQQQARFDTLDSWRGICAILIVIFHFTALLPTSLDTSRFLRNAYLFVDFFFVLSGFVLCHRYRGRIGSGQDVMRFVLRRFGRVWPLHAVVLALFVLAVAAIGLFPHPQNLAMTWHDGSYALDALLPSLLLLNAVNLQGSVWNGPAWSIGAEFYTYLLFAIVLVAAARRLIATSLVLSLGSLTLIFLLAPDLMNTTWDYGMVRCIAGFFAGVAAYHGYERLDRRDPIRATAWEATAVAAVAAFVLLAGDGPDAVAVASLAAPPVFALAVVVFGAEQGLLSLLLRMPPFRALGRYSFSIYMIHQPLLVLVGYAAWAAGHPTRIFHARASGIGGSNDLLLVDFVLAVVVLAAASYRFIEAPARARCNRMADRAGIRLRPVRGERRLAFSVPARRGRSRA